MKYYRNVQGGFQMGSEVLKLKNYSICHMIKIYRDTSQEILK
jgi:hypothetical protein